jgi:hypothetical protein
MLGTMNLLRQMGMMQSDECHGDMQDRQGSVAPQPGKAAGVFRKKR